MACPHCTCYAHYLSSDAAATTFNFGLLQRVQCAWLSFGDHLEGAASVAKGALLQFDVKGQSVVRMHPQWTTCVHTTVVLVALQLLSAALRRLKVPRFVSMSMLYSNQQ